MRARKSIQLAYTYICLRLHIIDVSVYAELNPIPCPHAIVVGGHDAKAAKTSPCAPTTGADDRTPGGKAGRNLHVGHVFHRFSEAHVIVVVVQLDILSVARVAV